MSDKDVERNVRSTTVDGISTPTQRHVHGIGEKHAISFGEKSQAKKTKESIIEKFRQRERKRKAATGLQVERETSESGDLRGEEDPPQ